MYFKASAVAQTSYIKKEVKCHKNFKYYYKEGKHGKRFILDENKQKLKQSVFDPQAIHHRSPMVWSAEDWLKLGDATDGNCGIHNYYKASRNNINCND